MLQSARLIQTGRIHFCHRYEVLDAHARKSIWRNFIEKARTDEKLEVHCDEEALERLSRLNFNGRQVRRTSLFFFLK